MKAIEKNILVVSTREPRLYDRRSENGDGLVNGLLEDKTSHYGQDSNEAGIENWIKNCTATAATLVHAVGQSEDICRKWSELAIQNHFLSKRLYIGRI